MSTTTTVVCVRCRRSYDPVKELGAWSCFAHTGRLMRISDAGLDGSRGVPVTSRTNHYTCCGYNPVDRDDQPHHGRCAVLRAGCVAVDHAATAAEAEAMIRADCAYVAVARPAAQTPGIMFRVAQKPERSDTMRVEAVPGTGHQEIILQLHRLARDLYRKERALALDRLEPMNRLVPVRTQRSEGSFDMFTTRDSTRMGYHEPASSVLGNAAAVVEKKKVRVAATDSSSDEDDSEDDDAGEEEEEDKDPILLGDAGQTTEDSRCYFTGPDELDRAHVDEMARDAEFLKRHDHFEPFFLVRRVAFAFRPEAVPLIRERYGPC